MRTVSSATLMYLLVGILACTLNTAAHRSLQLTACGDQKQPPCATIEPPLNSYGCSGLLQPRFGVCEDPPLPPLPAGQCYLERDLFGSPPYIDYFGASNTYNYWENNTFCLFTGDATITLDLKIRVHQPDNSCTVCPVPAECQIWHPDSIGKYRGWCSSSTTGNNFRMKTSYPGDEMSQNFGYDPYAHLHFACCCQGHCWKNKFYLTRSQLDFSVADDRLVTPDNTNIAVEWKPGFYRHTIVIPHDASDNVYYPPTEKDANILADYRASDPVCYKSNPVVWKRRLITTTNLCNQ